MRGVIVVPAMLLLACSSNGGGTTSADSSIDGTVPTETSVETSSDAVGGCPPGQTAMYEGPGCDGSNKFCITIDGPDACDAVVYFCDCEGKTREGICGSKSQLFPFRSEGACADAAAE